MNFASGEQYLSDKDRGLHQRPEVEFEQSQKRKQGRESSDKPADKIRDWLNVIEKTHLGHTEDAPEVLERIKKFYHEKYILPYQEEITRGAARVEGRAARQLGHGNIRYEGVALIQRQEIAVKDLEKSLDQWVDFLTHKEDVGEPNPIWFRYYVFTNIIKLGSYDYDKQEFRKRGKDTFFPFPDIDRGALAKVLELIQKGGGFADKSFAEQYTEAIKTNGEITPEMRAETKGEWKLYSQGSKPDLLWLSLQNKGVPWCTRGYATAEAQLEAGDFYVYYTMDKFSQPTIPRIAIRMDGDQIGEVRGVADNAQNLEGNMIEIAKAKYSELPGARRYEEADADMRTLTSIEYRVKNGEELSSQDLYFLYEIGPEITGFGYEPDPRIKEILDIRDRTVDLLNLARDPEIKLISHYHIAKFLDTFEDSEDILKNKELISEFVSLSKEKGDESILRLITQAVAMNLKLENGESFSDDELLLAYKMKARKRSFDWEFCSFLFKTSDRVLADRNPEIDLSRIFNCRPEEVSVRTSTRDRSIKEGAKVYFGRLYISQGNFEQAHSLKYVLGDTYISHFCALDNLSLVVGKMEVDESISPFVSPLIVEGSLRLNYFGGETLGNIRQVHGRLDFGHSENIKDLGALEKVEEILILNENPVIRADSLVEVDEVSFREGNNVAVRTILERVKNNKLKIKRQISIMGMKAVYLKPEEFGAYSKSIE